MTSTVDVLIAARKLIEKPENWCKQAWARTKKGEPTSAESKRACQFCAHGALVRAAGDFNNPLREAAFLSLRQAAGCPDGFPGTWQDALSHAEVLAAFDRAIAAERAKKPA